MKNFQIDGVKQVLFTILAMLMSLSAFSHAIEVANSDGVTIYYYWTNNKTELSVTYLGSDVEWRFNSDRYTGKVVIPESVIYNGKTYSVTEIGFNAFSNCTGLTSIEIPNSVKSIGMEAFSGCTGLTSIEIPKSVTSIGSGAFIGCSGLTSIEIPNSVTSIGGDAFHGCRGLTSINIPNSVTSIGSYAFNGCTGLTSVTIPNSVTSIDEKAFKGCTGLTSINIPNSVTSIGSGAFSGCTGLTSVTLDCSYIGSWLSGLGSIKEITLGEHVTRIGYGTFSRCTGLISITIPNSVTSIGGEAFSGCTGLSSIKIPNSVTSIGEFVFADCKGLTSIEIPNSVTSIGSSAFNGCSGLTSIEIPNSVTCIGNQAFQSCSDLTSIEIPNSVTSIGDDAFFGCTGLTSIKVEEGNCNYDSRNNCNAIIETSTNTLIAGCNSTVIPNSVTSIGNQAFQSCSDLTSIEIPNSVTSIGSYAFSDCIGLTDIYCYATIVPATSASFEGTKTYNITLHVPTASIDAYRKTAPWNSFKTIVGISGTEPSTFQLIYMIDGVEYKTYVVEEGAFITPESAPTKEGYTFSGWDYVPTTMPAEDVVVNGTFTVNSTEQETEDNAIYAEDVTGFVGSKIVLPIVMNNTEDIIGLQFDVTLPEGVNVEIDEDDEYMFTLTNRATSSHNVIANKLGDGRYRVLVSSMQNRQFKGCEGTVMEAMLAIPKHMAAGEYPVTISKIEMSTAQNIAIRPNAFVSKLTVRDIMPGDANGDGTVSVTDVTMTISHILGLTPEGFIAEAADVNEDGSISVTDVTILIDMILKQK